MTDPLSSEERKKRAAANFNRIAATYDQLKFLRATAERLVALAGVSPGARVLDVATGTGLVATAAAHAVGPAGRVTGIDLSPEMLARATARARALALRHVDFREADAERLPFPDGHFDVVLCASSLFFLPDMAAAVGEWRRVVRPGGLAGFSSYGPAFLQPLRDRWTAHLELFGVTAPILPTYRLEDPETCESLLRQAGFRDVGVRTEQLGYYASSAEERMADILAGVEGLPLTRVDAQTSARIQAGHLEELHALKMPQGIWIDVPAHFAFGRRPDA